MAAYSRSLRSREKELILVRKRVCAHDKKGLRSRAYIKLLGIAALQGRFIALQFRLSCLKFQA